MRKVIFIAAFLALFFAGVGSDSSSDASYEDHIYNRQQESCSTCDEITLTPEKAITDNVISYIYDENGNLLSDMQSCYTYNDANQVAAVRDCITNELIAEYLYDHTGQRVVEKLYEGGELIKTVYTVGDHYETQIASDGSRDDTAYYRANNELIASKNWDDSTFFYYPDHLGSTSIVTAEAGNLVEETRYYPYGTIRIGGSASRYLYTGQEWDPETNLYYYGARFYDPNLQRFVQADLLLPDPYDPQQLNRYTYVNNNPLVYIDPTGERAIIDEQGYLTIDPNDDSPYLVWDGKKILLNDYQEFLNQQATNSGPIQVIPFSDERIQEIIGPRVQGVYVNKYLYILLESWGNRKLDYDGTLNIEWRTQTEYMSLRDSEKAIFVIDNIAYTSDRAGDYLWAKTLNELNIPLKYALAGASAHHSLMYGLSFDNPADTRAHIHAYGYTSYLYLWEHFFPHSQ